MSKHLAVLYGPQRERINVICDSEAEARALESRAAETRTSKPKRQRGPQGEVLPCPECGCSVEHDEDDEQNERE